MPKIISKNVAKKTVKATAKGAGKASPKKAVPAVKKAEKATPAKDGNGKAFSVTPNMIKVLTAVSKANHPINAAEIVKKTGIVKGKRLPELVEAGLIKVLLPEEGERGRRFTITKTGLKAISK